MEITDKAGPTGASGGCGCPAGLPGQVGDPGQGNKDAILNSIIFDKQLRVDIDALVQRLRQAPKSAERTLSYRALQTAKHWLGEDLAILGQTNPYPNSKDVTNPIVDPPTDCVRTAAWDEQREAIAKAFASEFQPYGS